MKKMEESAEEQEEEQGDGEVRYKPVFVPKE